MAGCLFVLSSGERRIRANPRFELHRKPMDPEKLVSLLRVWLCDLSQIAFTRIARTLGCQG